MKVKSGTIYLEFMTGARRKRIAPHKNTHSISTKNNMRTQKGMEYSESNR